jgi:RHS repeat-associated protein
VKYLLSLLKESILCLVVFLMLSSSAAALDPPPECQYSGSADCHHAYCWGSWANARIDKKTINKDDIVTIKVNIVGGPKAGIYCGYSQWHKQGTNSVKVNFPESSCFQLVDYSPKGDTFHSVTTGTTSVTWTVLTPDPAPPSTVNDHCFCRTWGGGQWADTTACPPNTWPADYYGPGDTFTVTLKATCSRIDTNWKIADLAVLSGNVGVSCSGDPNIAQDYYKFGGSTSVSLTADPTSLPADGSVSQLSARVYETESGVNMPGQTVNFSMLFGFLNPPTAISDGSGIAAGQISSPGVEGNNIVRAAVPGGGSDQITVGFIKPDKPVVGPEAELGRLTARSLIGEPVHAGTGNYVYSRRLFDFPGKGLPVDFEVFYNSQAAANDGPLGFGWTHTFNTRLAASEPDVTIHWGDGHQDHFRNDGTGAYLSLNSKTTVVLTKPDADNWLATLNNQIVYRFNAAGNLLAIADLNDNQITFTHSSHLDRITDTVGRQIDFTYAGDRISAIATPLTGGATAAFQYDANGNLTVLTDARGKSVGFTYDGSHRVLTYTDATGATVLTNEYNGEGRISQQTDGAGHVTTYAYTLDSAGTITVVTPPSGNAIQHHYDTALTLIKVIDGEGNQAQFECDRSGQVMSMTDKKSTVQQFGYDAAGNLAADRDRTGALTSATYNALNRPTMVTDPLGNATSFTYDAKGNLTGVTDPLKYKSAITINSSGLPTSITDFNYTATWTFTYDSAGLLQTATDPLGHQNTYKYNSAGRVTQITAPIAGISTQMAYDGAGNLTSRTDPLGYVTIYTYNDNGQIAASTFEPTAATVTYAYDWAGRPVKVTGPLGGETTFTYDADGNLTKVTDPDGIAVTHQYDRANRLTAVLDPLGHGMHYTYDENGDTTAVRDELSNAWTTVYDAEGRPVSSTDPAGGTSSVLYDAAGQATQIIDELGNVEILRYGKTGEVVETTAPDQGVTRYGYDGNGNLTSVTDPLNHTWTFNYNALGQLTSETDPNGAAEQYAYDALGRLTSLTRRDGSAVTYAYDNGSRLMTMTLPGSIAVTYAYDAAGNVTGVTDPSGTTTMTYDKLGRRLSRTDPNGKTITFTYSSAGRLLTMTYPGSKVVTYAYDTAGRLTTVTDWLGNITTFSYDSVDRVTRIDLPNGTKTRYTYDAASRVATRISEKADAAVIASYCYGYDASGRITSVQRTQPQPTVPEGGSATFSYDPVNRVLVSTINQVNTNYAFDDRGNLIEKASGGASTGYSYDALNRMVAVNEGANATTYAYDIAGNRLSKTHNGTTNRYVREGPTVYMTLDEAGAVTSYNIHAGSLLYSLDSSNAIRVYHADERGSVVAVTNAAQDIVQSYAYDPYGRGMGSTGSLDNPFRFIGTYGVMTDENGLYHMHHRYYDSELRRFITEDPIGLEGGLNLYGYVAGDPISHIDPTGLEFSVRKGVFKPVEQQVPKGIFKNQVPKGVFKPREPLIPKGVFKNAPKGVFKPRDQQVEQVAKVFKKEFPKGGVFKPRAPNPGKALAIYEPPVKSLVAVEETTGGVVSKLPALAKNPVLKSVTGFGKGVIKSPIARKIAGGTARVYGTANVVGNLVMAYETGNWIGRTAQSVQSYDPVTGQSATVEELQYDLFYKPHEAGINRLFRPFDESPYDPVLERQQFEHWLDAHGLRKYYSNNLGDKSTDQ